MGGTTRVPRRSRANPSPAEGRGAGRACTALLANSRGLRRRVRRLAAAHNLPTLHPLSARPASRAAPKCHVRASGERAASAAAAPVLAADGIAGGARWVACHRPARRAYGSSCRTAQAGRVATKLACRQGDDGSPERLERHEGNGARHTTRGPGYRSRRSSALEAGEAGESVGVRLGAPSRPSADRWSAHRHAP